MKLDTSNIPPGVSLALDSAGAVYRNNHGNLVLCLGRADQWGRDGYVAVVTFNQDGTLKGANRYGAGYLDHLHYIGHVTNLPDVLEIEWRGQ